MKISIICVGKLKEKYLLMAADEYIKRLSRYSKINIIEVADEKTPFSLSDREKEIILKKEGERILAHLYDDSFKIALCIEGRQLDSLEFSQSLRDSFVAGKSHVSFVIGGSLGLWKNVCDRCDFILSFSKMTFPHQLMRVILLEQLYRCFRIMNNEPYHK